MFRSSRRVQRTSKRHQRQTIFPLVESLEPRQLLSVAVPLPPPGDMTASAYGGFAEIFLEVKDSNNSLGLAAGIYNDVGIGVFDAVADNPADPATLGLQPGYVLYTGANTSVAGPASKPTTIKKVDGVNGFSISDLFGGAGAFAGKTQGRLYVGGVINTIDTLDSVTYNHGGGDLQPNPELTFALYNAHIQSLTVNFAGGDQLTTNFTLTGDKAAHFDIWADATPLGGTGDASLGATAGPGQRYASASTAASNRTPELPVRDDNAAGNAGTLLVDLDDGTYYDRSVAKDWGELAFAGDPADNDVVFWSFVANPNSVFQVTENFVVRTGAETINVAADLNGDGDTTDVVNGVNESAVVVYVSGTSGVTDPSNLGLQGQLLPGKSLITDPSKVRPDGTGFGNDKLLGDYTLTGQFAYGGQVTGAYDSDPRTFTFQQGYPGAVSTLTQITGKLVVRPDINIVKLTNGTDNDSPTGPIVQVGSTVVWTYIVTNPGSEPVANVVVVDDNGTPLNTADDFNPNPVLSGSYNIGDINTDNLLDTTETWQYTFSGIAIVGQYENYATVTGVGATSGIPVEDDNPDHYFGQAGKIDIEKYVKVIPQTPLSCGRITGGGSFFRPLTATEQAYAAAHNINPAGLNLRVTHGFELHCDPLKNNRLEINWFDVISGREFSFHLTQLLTAQCIDTALVQAPPKSSPFDTFIATGVGRVKQGSGPAVDGFTIAFTFVDGGPTRGEPGIYDTARVVIKDGGGNMILVVDFPSPLIHGNHQTHLDKKAGGAGSVPGVDPDPTFLGFDADTPGGPDVPQAQVGDTVKFNYLVTNPGNVSLANVVVTDDNATPINTADDFNPAPVLSGGFNVGDDDKDGFLDPGEQWLYTSSIIASTVGCFTNISVVTGNPVVAPTVVLTDSDPANWCVVEGQTPVCGRMTGGGSIFTDDGQRVTHGMELHCDPLISPSNLEINWAGGNNFHLTQLVSATCAETILDQEHPSAPFDTLEGTGIGRLNGVDGYSIQFVLTDAGEPGSNDYAEYLITAPNGDTVLFVSGLLTHGNQQAHEENKTAPPPPPALTAALSLAAEEAYWVQVAAATASGKTVNVTITNTGDTAQVIKGISLNWAAVNGKLMGISINGVTILKDNTSGTSGTFSDFVGSVLARTIAAGKSVTISFLFQGTADVNMDDYDLSIDFGFGFQKLL